MNDMGDDVAMLKDEQGAHPQLGTWIQALDRVLDRLERSEMTLSSEGLGRRNSGSYYTPADVAAHFWRLFWRHHNITSRDDAARFIDASRFVEPSVGSGIFLFSMLRSLAEFGIGPTDLSELKFEAIDINRAALDLVAAEMRALEEPFSVAFKGVSLEHANFLHWIGRRKSRSKTFVGNPPFVSNERGSRWKNVYADFVEAMLGTGPTSSLSLILPVSVCFSRDYIDLRRLLKASELPLSASSYDNIPDCLFKAGKPESGNSNKSNSQRCTILNLGGAREGVIESSPLLRWTAGGRKEFLEATPRFHDCSGFDLERQIPRPSDDQLTQYLHEAEGGRSTREFMSRIGRGAFAVGSVARNFIGIRDYAGSMPGVTAVKTNEKDSSLILLQIFSSSLFYKYWRSFGDGFHVTADLIDRFPISVGLLKRCESNLGHASHVWADREKYAKTKLNSGKVVKSYDFAGAFEASTSN